MTARTVATENVRVGWVAQWATAQRVHWWKHLASVLQLRTYLLDEAPSEFSPGVPAETSLSFSSERVRTSRIHTPWTWAPQYYWHDAAKTISQAPLDVMVLNGWAQIAFLQALRAASRRRLPTIMYFEPSGRASRPLERRLRALLLDRVDGVIAAGPRAERELIHSGVRRSRIATISPPAVLAPAGAGLPDSALGLGRSSGHLFLFVGRLVAGKNIHGLLRAFARIRRQEDELVVVGSGPGLSAIQRDIRSLQIEDGVRLVGSVSHEQVGELMRVCHTLVLPSFRESWGLVANEGLLTGMHAVVSRAAAVSDDVAGDEGVYLAEPDVASLAAALRRSREAWSGRIPSPKQGGRGTETATAQVVDLLRRIDL